MRKLVIVVALPCLVALSACQQREHEANRAERSAQKMEKKSTKEEYKAGKEEQKALDEQQKAAAEEQKAKDYGRGEGEREKAIGEGERAMGEAPVSDSEAIATYKQSIAGDADLRREAGDTRLVLEEGKLVLHGTVPTKDLSDALANLAKQSAGGRDIDNQLVIAPESRGAKMPAPKP